MGTRQTSQCGSSTTPASPVRQPLEDGDEPVEPLTLPGGERSQNCGVTKGGAGFAYRYPWK